MGSEFRQTESGEAFLKQPDIETDPLSQEIYVRLAQVRNQSFASPRLKDS